MHLDSERDDHPDDTDYVDAREASHQGVLHIGGEGDTEPARISHAFPAYEEEELSYTDKLPPRWDGSESTYLRYLRALEMWEVQAAHLVKETPAPNLTAGMMAGRIRGGRAHQWLQEHAETAKMKETTGKEYLLREFAKLYEKSQPEKVITAWADVTSVTLSDTKKNKPADDNVYEHFIREYKTRVERFKTAARGTSVSNTFPEPIQAINALWRLQLPPKEPTRVISFMHEDVQKDMFKLTMAELQRVVRLTLVPNKELSELYGRSKPTDHNYWHDDWSSEWPDDQDGWGDSEESNTHDSGAHDDQSYYGKYGKATPTFKPKGPPKGWSSPGKNSTGGQPFGGKASGKAKPSVWRRKDPASTYVASDGSVWEAEDPSPPEEDTQADERADEDQEAYFGKRGQAAGSREPRARPKVQFALSKPRQAPGKFQLRPGEGDESVGRKNANGCDSPYHLVNNPLCTRRTGYYGVETETNYITLFVNVHSRGRQTVPIRTTTGLTSTFLTHDGMIPW